MIKEKKLLTSFIYFLFTLADFGAKIYKPMGLYTAEFSGYEIQNLNKFAYKSMGLYAG